MSIGRFATTFMDNFIKINAANCQKKRAATLIMNKMSNINTDFIAITEPFVGPHKKATFQAPWNIHCREVNSRAILITPPLG